MKTFKNSLILIALCAVMLGVASCGNEAYNDQYSMTVSDNMQTDSSAVESNLTVVFKDSKSGIDEILLGALIKEDTSTDDQ